MYSPSNLIKILKRNYLFERQREKESSNHQFTLSQQLRLARVMILVGQECFWVSQKGVRGSSTCTIICYLSHASTGKWIRSRGARKANGLSNNRMASKWQLDVLHHNIHPFDFLSIILKAHVKLCRTLTIKKTYIHICIYIFSKINV